MKYIGTSWVLVGTAGFSASNILETSLAIDGSGTPYLAYTDYSYYKGQATVMKYNGTSWVPVGTAGFGTSGGIGYPSLTLDGSGSPYLAYAEYSYNGRATVSKYDGTSWVVVGRPAFSPASVSYISLALDGSGTPFVAYNDEANNYKATVMKFSVPAATVTSIFPTSGITVGGTSVSITGTDFTGATSVKFGSVEASSFTVNSTTSITATSPAGSVGAVDITVTTAVGTSATSSADKFTYYIAPVPDYVIVNGVKWAKYNLGTGGAFVTSETDYGGLYQWGRPADGHEAIKWISTTAGTGGTTDVGPVSAAIAANTGFFYTASRYDWLTPQDNKRWNFGTETAPVKTANDPSPAGWRVPTKRNPNMVRWC
jgi:hypothetical protein